MDQIVAQVLQLGVGGLFFFMWWNERVDRMKSDKTKDTIEMMLRDANARESKYTTVIENNTKAMTEMCLLLKQELAQ